jgi:hypothetical protein
MTANELRAREILNEVETDNGSDFGTFPQAAAVFLGALLDIRDSVHDSVPHLSNDLRALADRLDSIDAKLNALNERGADDSAGLAGIAERLSALQRYVRRLRPIEHTTRITAEAVDALAEARPPEALERDARGYDGATPPAGIPGPSLRSADRFEAEESGFVQGFHARFDGKPLPPAASPGYARGWNYVDRLDNVPPLPSVMVEASIPDPARIDRNSREYCDGYNTGRSGGEFAPGSGMSGERRDNYAAGFHQGRQLLDKTTETASEDEQAGNPAFAPEFDAGPTRKQTLDACMKSPLWRGNDRNGYMGTARDRYMKGYLDGFARQPQSTQYGSQSAFGGSESYQTGYKHGQEDRSAGEA